MHAPVHYVCESKAGKGVRGVEASRGEATGGRGTGGVCRGRLLIGPRGLETLHTVCPSRGRGAERAPASPASHLPLPRGAAPGAASPATHCCPGKLRSAPRHPACIPCGLRSREEVKPGGALRPTGTPTHHRDMAARAGAVERRARITALAAAAGDGGTGPGRAPAETFFSRRLEEGPQGRRPRYLNPWRPGLPWGQRLRSSQVTLEARPAGSRGEETASQRP